MKTIVSKFVLSVVVCSLVGICVEEAFAQAAPTILPPPPPSGPTLSSNQVEVLQKLAETFKVAPPAKVKTEPMAPSTEEEALKLMLAVIAWEAEIYQTQPLVTSLRTAGQTNEAALQEWGVKASRLDTIRRARNNALARLAIYAPSSRKSLEDEAKKELEEEKKK